MVLLSVPMSGERTRGTFRCCEAARHLIPEEQKYWWEDDMIDRTGRPLFSGMLPLFRT